MGDNKEFMDEISGISTVAVRLLPKQETRVRLSYPAHAANVAQLAEQLFRKE